MSIKNIAWKKIDIALAGALVALVAVLSWYAWVQYVPGFGVLRMDSLAAPNYIADAVTISADGTQVAILHQEISNGPGPFVVEVRNVQSGQQISKFTMPRAVDDRTTPYYDLSRKLSFCDGGKYLVAFAPPDRLYLADTRTFQCVIQSSVSIASHGRGPGTQILLLAPPFPSRSCRIRLCGIGWRGRVGILGGPRRGRDQS